MGKDLQTIFDVMDKDGSGGISIDEFVNAFYMD
jgi:Ca2+-binding EF-hand superfamily protein